MKIYNSLFIGLLLAIFVVGNMQAQSLGILKTLDDLEVKEGVTTVLVTKKMFELFAKTTDINVEGESINDVISTLDKLLIYDVDLSSSERNSIATNIINTLKRDGYEILMKVNDVEENVEIYILEEKDIVKHLFLIAKNKVGLQVISLQGNIDLEKISKLSGTLNVEELKLLDQRKK